MKSEKIELKNLYDNYCNTLLSKIGDRNECESVVRILLNHFFKVSYTDILLNKFVETNTRIKDDLNNAIKSLLQNQPIQYVLSYEYFLDRKFIVNKNVLIPRPETEDLVLLIIANNLGKENLKILDIGTGSGCIGISLQKELKTPTTHAIDISRKAIIVAQQNAKNLDAEILFFEKNILQTDKLSQKYNIIVSNPPYVLESEKKSMRTNVLDYEPSNALFVPDENGLIFYKKIIDLAKNALLPNGKLYFEINENFGNEVIELLQKKEFSHIKLYKDRHDKNRIVEGIMAPLNVKKF